MTAAHTATLATALAVGLMSCRPTDPRAIARPSSPEPYDLVIFGGSIVDGTGRPRFAGDVAVDHGRVVQVGDLSRTQAKRRIDARGKLVAPGFIDMLGQSEWTVLADGRAASKIRQGFTTELTGEASSPAPMVGPVVPVHAETLGALGIVIDWTDLNGYFQQFARSGSTINLGAYVGAAQIRVAVLGLDDVQPSESQLAQMRALVRREMANGAFGVSSALEYVPGSYSRAPELVALAMEAARYGGVYATHLRDQGDRILDAIDEALEIAQRAHAPLQIWHLKVMGRRNWGTMHHVLERLERARRTGMDVRASVYPYTASANGLDYYLPRWALEGDADVLVSRLGDPKVRARLRSEIETGAFQAHPPEDIEFVGPASATTSAWTGKRLSAIATLIGKSPADALLDIISTTRNKAMAIEFSASEDDLRLALQTPWITFDTDYQASATDGRLAGTMTHPRAFSTTARILARYVRDERLLSLEEAVRRLTGLPAEQLGLRDRGVIAPGLRADLVVFDLAQVRDEATYEAPKQYPRGIADVVVNGRVVVDHDGITDARPGEPVRHAQAP